TGLPTNTGNTLSNITAITSGYGFAFVDVDGVSGADLLYVADESATGILKFSSANEGSTWTARGTLAGPAGATGFSGVAAQKNNDGTFGVFATTENTSGGEQNNKLVTFTDSAAFNATMSASAFTTLASPTNNTVLRGIAWAPTP